MSVVIQIKVEVFCFSNSHVTICRESLVFEISSKILRIEEYSLKFKLKASRPLFRQ